MAELTDWPDTAEPAHMQAIRDNNRLQAIQMAEEACKPPQTPVGVAGDVQAAHVDEVVADLCGRWQRLRLALEAQGWTMAEIEQAEITGRLTR